MYIYIYILFPILIPHILIPISIPIYFPYLKGYAHCRRPLSRCWNIGWLRGLRASITRSPQWLYSQMGERGKWSKIHSKTSSGEGSWRTLSVTRGTLHASCLSRPSGMSFLRVWGLPWGILLEAFWALPSVLEFPRREIWLMVGVYFRIGFFMVCNAILDRSRTSKTSISRKRGIANHVSS